jgi:hypothetical protein
VVGSGPALELRPGFDHVLDARMGMPFNYRLDPNEGLHLFRIKTSKRVTLDPSFHLTLHRMEDLRECLTDKTLTQTRHPAG